MNISKDIILTNSIKTDAFNSLENFNVYHFPMIDIKVKSIKPFNLSDFDYYIFTSQNSVDAFFEYSFVQVQYETQIKAICLGKKTEQKLRQFGAAISFSSHSSYSLDMISELKQKKFIENSKIVVVGGNLLDFTKYDILKNIAFVSKLEIYHTIKNTSFDKTLNNLLKKGNSISVFASPSSFDAFVNLYENFNTDIFCIGSTTSDFIRSKGFNVKTAKEQTFESVAKEILNNYNV